MTEERKISEAEMRLLAPSFEIPTVRAADGALPPFAHEIPQPGTLQIELLGETAIPILTPLPDASAAVILTNDSGGQMTAFATTGAGVISVVVPNSGKLAIKPTSSAVIASEISVIVRRVTPWAIVSERRVISRTGDGNATPAIPPSGLRSINLDGKLS